VSESPASSVDVPEAVDSSQTIHATALVVGETGVLIRGRSGAGKSALALALLAVAGERRMFARLIGDDRVLLRQESGRLLLTGAPNVRGLIEWRGYGIVAVQAELCAIARLVVDLLPPQTQGARAPIDAALKARLAGVTLPRLIFGGESGPLERAYAVLGRLDKTDDKNMTGFAHFA
jgi:HPr kinase/phosphorylase